jgi:hypothetical protein
MKPHEPPGCHELLHRPLGERPLTPARPRLPASFRPRNRCPRSVLRFHWTSNRSARVSWRSSPGKQSACHSTTPRQGALGLGTQGMCEQSDWANGRAGVRVEMKWNEGARVDRVLAQEDPYTLVACRGKPHSRSARVPTHYTLRPAQVRLGFGTGSYCGESGECELGGGQMPCSSGSRSSEHASP